MGLIPRRFIVHPSWVEALLRDPSGAGLLPGDRLYTTAGTDGPLVRIHWEEHVRSTHQASHVQLPQEKAVRR